MQVSPRLLGAGAAVLLAGVASGAVIGKVPPMRYLAQDDLLPQAEAGALAWTPPSALPDHYPIVTPEGRFEVYQLADRGLYRQARYAADYPVEAYAVEPDTWTDDPAAGTVEPVQLAAAPGAAREGVLEPPMPEHAGETAAPPEPLPPGEIAVCRQPARC